MSRYLDADLVSKRFRVPCAGCGRKLHPTKLRPVFHGPVTMDKRCDRCVEAFRGRADRGKAEAGR